MQGFLLSHSESSQLPTMEPPAGLVTAQLTGSLPILTHPQVAQVLLAWAPH